MSTGYTSTSSAVGSGTLTFTFGTTDAGTFTADTAQAVQQVTIAPGQATLAGVRHAI